MQNSLLPDRAVISLFGVETIPFLQGLISNDSAQLANGTPVFAALLSPQGRFLHDFFLVPHEGKIYVDIAKARVDDFISRLKLYRLRIAIDTATEDQLKIAAYWDTTSPPEGNIVFADPRLSALGYRAILPADSAEIFSAAETDYEIMRLSHCVPDTKDMIVDRSLLLECGYEELHGVNFSKGCYVGQEVTARSKFRGQVRKHFFAVNAASPLPAFGSMVTAGELTIGELRSVQGNKAIALLNAEAAATAQQKNEPIRAGDIEIQVSTPTWLLPNTNASEELRDAEK